MKEHYEIFNSGVPVSIMFNKIGKIILIKHLVLKDILCKIFSNMPFEYHVTCSDTLSKKLIVVGDKSAVVKEIQERFGISNDIIIQRPFGDDWLDVDEEAELPGGGKLMFLKKPITGLKS